MLLTVQTLWCTYQKELLLCSIWKMTSLILLKSLTHRVTVNIIAWPSKCKKGYPDWALLEVWMDTPPFHSLRLTIEHQEQAHRLCLKSRTIAVKLGAPIHQQWHFLLQIKEYCHIDRPGEGNNHSLFIPRDVNTTYHLFTFSWKHTAQLNVKNIECYRNYRMTVSVQMSRYLCQVASGSRTMHSGHWGQWKKHFVQAHILSKTRNWHYTIHKKNTQT